MRTASPMRIARSLRFFRVFLLTCLTIAGSLPAARAQAVSDADRDRGRVMLRAIKDSIKKNYYDPTFRGIDLDARFKAAEEKINQAAANSQIFGVIAQLLSQFKDSHLYFIPPQRSARVGYGWQMQMLGDRCFVVAVKPGSDAEAKGLTPGDQVLAVDNIEPTRDNMNTLQYLYYMLRPRPGVRLIVQKPNGKKYQLDVAAQIKPGKPVLDLTLADGGVDLNSLLVAAENENRLSRHRYYEFEKDLLVWRMPAFDLEPTKVDDMMDRARRRKALILDLRGNGGGREDTLLRMIGHFFDQDLKVGDVQRRKERKPLVAKTRGADRTFKGKLVVLVDSESGSSAEILARVMQAEKRGVVVGDRSAGAVMRSRSYPHQTGVETVVFYAVSVTDADLIMTDGKSLEGVGVTPDEVLLPTAADLASKCDPALSRAAALVGYDLSPDKAGAMFPVEWGK